MQWSRVSFRPLAEHLHLTLKQKYLCIYWQLESRTIPAPCAAAQPTHHDHSLQVLSELQLNLRLGASERAAVVAQEFEGCSFLFAKLVGLPQLVESVEPR